MQEPRVARYRGQWVLYWREDGEPKRRVLKDEHGQPVASREDADRVALDVQRLAVRPRGDLVRDLADKYFKDKKGRLASYDNMHFAWKAIEAKVGHLRAEHITREWCRAHTEEERAKGRADGTIRKQLTVLSAICRWSDKNTPATIEMPPLPPPRDRHLTHDEAARLVAAATGPTFQPHIRLFIILAICTAGRAGAILEMTWDQIDFERDMIDLGRGVGNKGRARVRMNRTARLALADAKKAALSDYVIEYAGGPVKSIKKGFALACKRAKLEGVHPHVLRHTAAVWMAEAGRPMSEIAQYLGHENDKITQRVYARFSPEHFREASAALELELGPKEVPANTGALPTRGAK